MNPLTIMEFGFCHVPTSLDRHLDPKDTATDSGVCECGNPCNDLSRRPPDLNFCCVCTQRDPSDERYFCSLCEERVAQDEADNERETEPFADNNDPGIPKA